MNNSTEAASIAHIGMGVSTAMSCIDPTIYYIDGRRGERSNNRRTPPLPAEKKCTHTDFIRLAKAQEKRERKLKRNLELAKCAR